MLEEHQLQLLSELAYRIKQASEISDSDIENLKTASALARDFGLKQDFIKKHLKLLKEHGLILSIGLNPKRYRFDNYKYRIFLSETSQNNALHALIDKIRLIEEVGTISVNREDFSRYRRRK